MPPEPDTAMTEARRLCAEADDAALQSFVEDRLHAARAPEELVNIGITCRDHQKWALAFKVFDVMAARWPGYAPTYYEAAFAQRIRGEHLEAVRLLLAAQRCAPRNIRIATFLVHMLHMIGAHDEAVQSYRATAPIADISEATRLEVVHEFGRYIQSWPYGRAMLLLDRIQTTYDYIASPCEIAKDIVEALLDRRPFALIRLGDGEGSCVSLGLDDESQFRNLYANNRTEFIKIWFGADFDPDRTGFSSISRTIIPEALGADIVGVPYKGWLSHEYSIASVRGIPSLVNILQALSLVWGKPGLGPRLTTQQIHVDLDQAGELREVLRHAKQITVITCLAGVAELLKQQLELDVTLHQVPGEKGMAHILGAEATSGVHYPDTFSRIQSLLATSHQGTLFLVAAGILGKFYALTVKRFGGVAIDIGSVVDGWMGKLTRPGMSQR